MKPNLRLGLSVMAVGAAVIVAGVLLALSPWSGEEAAGGTIQYRLCDTVIEAGVREGRGDIQVTQLIEPDVPPSLEVGVVGENSTVVAIDPTTPVDVQAVQADADERLQPVLGTLRTESLNPATAPWPYTDAVQMSPVRRENGTFRLRFPDPGSGLVVSMTYNQTTDGSLSRVLHLANFRSSMNIDARFRPDTEPEITVTRDVHPDDEAAFETFYNEVTVQEPKRW